MTPNDPRNPYNTYSGTYGYGPPPPVLRPVPTKPRTDHAIGFAIVSGLVAVTIGLTALATCGSSSSTAKAVRPKPLAPTQGDELVTDMAMFWQHYQSAQNEVQQSGVFQKARTYETTLFGFNVDVAEWKGTLKSVATTKGGETVMAHVDMCKGDFCISFSADHQSIQEPAFQSIVDGSIAEGSCVLFSGMVNPKEDSLTERGAMRNPEYKVKFSALKPCQTNNP